MNPWKRKAPRLPIVLLGTALATAYFAFHAVFGTHGLQAKARLHDRLDFLQREAAVLEAVRSQLKQDVKALTGEMPDPDIVEEIARGVLGWGRPGDLGVARRR